MLYLTLAATAAVAAILGLALSAAARSHDQILPMLVLAVMLSIVFCGGMIPVTGRFGLEQLSWTFPARWGFAATASTTDLRTIAPLLQTKDTLWSHHSGWWLLDMGALIVVGIVLAGYMRWRIRLGAVSQSLNRTAWYRLCLRQWSLVPMGRWSPPKTWAHARPRCGRVPRRGGTLVPMGERPASNAPA